MELVARFHEVLFGLYDKINWSRLLVRAVSSAPASAESDQSEFSDLTFEDVDPDLVEVARHCRTVAQADESDAPPAEEMEAVRPRHIPRIRMRPFLAVLRDEFGCEVRQGKGSEVTVYRPGAKKYRLGRHGVNPEVPAVLVHDDLRRSRIAVADWVRAARA